MSDAPFGLATAGKIRASSAIVSKSQSSYSLVWSPSHTLQIIHPTLAEALIFEPSSKSRGAGEWVPRMEGSLENLQV